MKLIIKNIEKSFDDKNVLKDASFTFEKGKIYGLLGRNGSGKTTLFNCINEDIEIDNGTFHIEEDGIERTIVTDDLGYVLSSPIVPEFLTGYEFIQFFLDINKERVTNTKTADEYLDFMKIVKADRNKLMKDYSYGMKNKMQILVNFIANPNILLLDEPLTSFDVVIAEEMKNMLRALKHDHIIIFSTHIMELALGLCDKIVILSNGELNEIEKNELDDEAFKSKIIESLKEETNV